MFVIMIGSVGVYMDNELDNCVVELKANSTFGERSLQTTDRRSANVIAHKATVCLVLSKDDFYNQVFHIEHLQTIRRLNYLFNLEFFKNWNYELVK